MTTTYISTNARPCASCQGTLGRCLPACPDRSGTLVIGEILFDDGTSMPVPPSDGLTMTGMIRAINEAPQSHAKRRNGDPWVPMWTLVLIFAGGVLAALGLVFQDPVARLIWEAIHG